MGDCKNNDFLSSIKKVPVVLCPPRGAKVLLDEGRVPVLLIRHGQTDWNISLRLQGRECVPLNEMGLEQAKVCGELLIEAEKRGLHITDIFTSPLSRARVTAETLGEMLGVENPVLDEEGLIERDYGELSGLTLEERKSRFPRGERQARGVESVPKTAVRMKKCVYNLGKKSSGGAVVAVTHGGIINAFYLQVTRSKIGTGKNICENCHVSMLAVGKGATIPLFYNLGGEQFLDYIEQMNFTAEKGQL